MENKADGLTAFKNQIFLYGIAVALIFEGISLLFIGFDGGFAYGLALGVAIAIVNFSILASTLKRSLASGKKGIVFVSYIVRLCIYGFAFYMAMRVSLAAGGGAALGFVSLKVAIYYLHGFRKAFRAKRPAGGRGYRTLPEEKRKSWLDSLGWQEDGPDGDGPSDDGPPGDGLSGDGPDAGREGAVAAPEGARQRQVVLRGKTYKVRRNQKESR
ncbi:MAG: ATP synthase subunit I [Clostridiales Family XIII bacterium]|jgi:hypothetical protein|nr:ATP synthase subunit I [Clostridiales Family XIII bacterium]